MIKRFDSLSIKGKLISVIMASSASILILAAGGFVTYEYFTFQDSISHALLTDAAIVADSSTAALTFGDVRTATEVLSVLKREPRIVAAAIYGKDGKQFASYQREGGDPPPATAPKEPGVVASQGHLAVQHPIVVDSVRAGTVWVKRDLEDLVVRLKKYAGIAGGLLLISLLIGLVISTRAQRLISSPILRLSETALLVAKEKDYSVRALRSSNDEVGLLADRFNAMMSQIEVQDEELKQARDQLEWRVKERTMALESEIQERHRIEADLRTAKEAVEQASRAKSAFLANMSHELRTPLNAIIGYSEMLQEDFVQDLGLVSDLQRIHGAGKHLLLLINDVLDISKIEAGRMEVFLEPIMVRDILSDAASTAEPLAKMNRNRFVVDCADEEEIILADATRFRQGLFNLLSNACKFTQDGTVTLTVKAALKDRKRWVEWHVSDTGIGIAPEDIKKLFQSFSQVDASTTRKFGGTGLGLAITQKLCDLMGAEINVNSKPGCGSRFTIRVPCYGESSRPQENQIIEQIEKGKDVQDFASRR